MTAQTVDPRDVLLDPGPTPGPTPAAAFDPWSPVPGDLDYHGSFVVRQPWVQPAWVFASQGIVGAAAMGTWLATGFDQWGVLYGSGAALAAWWGCRRVERDVLGNRRYNMWHGGASHGRGRRKTDAERLREMAAQSGPAGVYFVSGRTVAVGGSHGAQEEG